MTFRGSIATLKQAGQQFLADDCMGLAQQVAYSSLLAFFPAVAFLLGLLGTVHLYGDVETLLSSVAPHGVIRFIRGLQEDSTPSASAVAFGVGLVLALWAASGAAGSVIKAVNRAYGCEETRPVWRVRLIAVVLVVLTGADDGGHGRADRLRRAARRGDREQGASRRRVGRLLGDSPLAGDAGGAADVLRARLLPRAECRRAQLEVDHAGRRRRVVALARAVGAVRALRDVRRLVLANVRRAGDRHHPAALAELHRVGDPYGAELNAQVRRQA